MKFRMNGILWTVRFVHPSDPILIDRTGKKTCAVTDPDTMSIFSRAYEIVGDEAIHFVPIYLERMVA